MTSVENTKNRLLEAAITEFAEHGYDKATLRDICKRADVNLNAVKYHFQDKEGLYIQAVKLAHHDREETIENTLPHDAPPEDWLKGFITGMLTMALAEDSKSNSKELLIMREMTSPTKATEEIVKVFIQPMFGMLDHTLKQLLPEHVKPIDRHLLAISVVGQCFHYKICQPVDKLLISKSEFSRFTVAKLADHVFFVTSAAIEAHWKK